MHAAHTTTPHLTEPPPDQAPAIAARDLVKTYPGGRGKPPVTALDGLSLDVPAGRVLGLLGPNGAGKSTTVKILATLSRADAGTASVAGIDVRRSPDAVRRRIGLVSQGASSDPIATGRENLVLAALLHGRSRDQARARADDLLQRFGLSAAADRSVKTYSGGMSRKLDIAIGLVHRPSVLFLDEPTTGLDPEARAEMWAEIARLSAAEAITVLLTTHYLDEADHLADTVAIVDRGRVVAQGAPEALKSELRGDTVVLELDDGAAAARAAGLLDHLPGVRDLSVEGASLRARADLGARAVPVVLALLDEHGVTVGSVTVARPSLDDVYLRHAGRAFEGGRL
jgi:ABC-2 type transport system ATP-binding protein